MDYFIDRERISIALLHYPVYDREGRIVATALTTIDLHDLARLARTYGLGAFFVVTPLRSQRELGKRMIDHWTKGPGAVYNPSRREAMALVEVVKELKDAKEMIRGRWGKAPWVVATSAKVWWGRGIGFGELAERMRGEEPYLLLFGTGWGLASSVIEEADFVLQPIEGMGYNHLSVRTAAAIIIDRLLGGR